MNKASQILNNLDAHIVDRKEKMNRSIDAHIDLMKKQESAKLTNSELKPKENNRGYGSGRNMGD